MIGYSPRFPLQIDDYVGAYALTQTVTEVVKQNFINLMLTAPGERIMDLQFGVGLRHYIFEPNIASTKQSIASKIERQTKKYMPFIRLNSIRFNTASIEAGYDDQILDISVDYSVDSLEEMQSMSVSSTDSSL